MKCVKCTSSPNPSRTSVLQMGKLMFRRVKSFVQGHKANKLWNLNVDLPLPKTEPYVLNPT